ncbi:hypothetical protein [Iningainema tapete]|uniref:Uncharacterized protein n=1 Tax=Iningainema tapete BLCC-T55 TaxID=2748662 RepID=A0A8J6XHH5_9CYAN|nr:hypothetical protein [Iningainema tapete]MBD2775974.1 hypothetical protein [Iningainema tapete BLCC-T55]
MDVEPQVTAQTTSQKIRLTEPPTLVKPLELLRDTEELLRRPTVAMLVPILPPKLSSVLQATSSVAEDFLKELASVDIEKISDFELRPARIRIGLSFVGFAALMIVVLLLYLNTLHPELSAQQIHKYWYQYIWFVSLGVAGMFILGREAMRPH